MVVDAKILHIAKRPKKFVPLGTVDFDVEVIQMTDRLPRNQE